jgi:hypothetical protein
VGIALGAFSFQSLVGALALVECVVVGPFLMYVRGFVNRRACRPFPNPLRLFVGCSKMSFFFLVCSL